MYLVSATVCDAPNGTKIEQRKIEEDEKEKTFPHLLTGPVLQLPAVISPKIKTAVHTPADSTSSVIAIERTAPM